MVDYDGIYVVDTLGATHLIGILARYARDLINQSVSAEEIAQKCENLKSKIKVFAGVDTLEYLYKGADSAARLRQSVKLPALSRLSP